MGKISTIAQVAKEFPAESPDALMVQALTVGEDIGTMINVGLDFIAP